MTSIFDALGRPAAPAFILSLCGVFISCAGSDSSTPAGTGGTGGTGGETITAGTTSIGTAGTTVASAGTVSIGGTATAGTGGISAGGSAGQAVAGSSNNNNGGSGGMVEPPPPQVCNVSADGLGDGSINYERWPDVPGTTIDAIPLDDPPGFSMAIEQLEVGGTNLENFGARIRGYLTAPLTGEYTFWVAGDDNVDFYISTDDSPDNKERVAYITGADFGWTNLHEWNKFATQKSDTVELEQGEAYYIEVLHKEGVNLDHVSVGWQLPGESGLNPCEVVPGTALSLFESVVVPMPDAGAGDGGSQ